MSATCRDHEIAKKSAAGGELSSTADGRLFVWYGMGLTEKPPYDKINFIMDESIYREQIIDLYENPLNQGALAEADWSYEEDNPLCGDVVRIEVKLGADGRVAQVGWQGDGCAISQAAASILTEEIKGLTLEEVRHFSKEKLLELLGVPLSMARVKCALLSLKVLKAGAYGIPDPATMRENTE